MNVFIPRSLPDGYSYHASVVSINGFWIAVGGLVMHLQSGVEPTYFIVSVNLDPKILSCTLNNVIRMN